ncbi:hypothetical protein [Geoglobus ahangari]
MLRIAMVAVITLTLIGTASAWSVEEVRYNTTTDVLKVCLELSPIERLISFFVGGDYTKTLVEDLLEGNYSFVYAGYDCSYIRVNGSVMFREPVDVIVEGMNETLVLQNVTIFFPTNHTGWVKV